VIEKIGFLVRFWELRGRHATLGLPLGPSEQIELLSLMQLVTADFKMPAAGPVGRPRTALPAQLIGEGAIVPVEIRKVSAAAVVVASLATIEDDARSTASRCGATSGGRSTCRCRAACRWGGESGSSGSGGPPRPSLPPRKALWGARFGPVVLERDWRERGGGTILPRSLVPSP